MPYETVWVGPIERVRIRGEKGWWLVVEGCVADGGFGAQRILTTGRGLRAVVGGREFWLHEMLRSFGSQEVVEQGH